MVVARAWSAVVVARAVIVPATAAWEDDATAQGQYQQERHQLGDSTKHGSILMVKAWQRER